MQTADSLEKPLMLVKTEVRRSGWQRMRWLDGIINAMHELGQAPGDGGGGLGGGVGTGKPGVMQFMQS